VLRLEVEVDNAVYGMCSGLHRQPRTAVGSGGGHGSGHARNEGLGEGMEKV
jgi:hypothetical protein